MQSVQRYVAVNSSATIPREIKYGESIKHQANMSGRTQNVINDVANRGFNAQTTIQIPIVQAEDYLVPSSAMVRFTVTANVNAAVTHVIFPYGGVGLFDLAELKMSGEQIEYCDKIRDVHELLSAQVVSADWRKYAGSYGIGINRQVTNAELAAGVTFELPLSYLFGFFRCDKLFPLKNLRTGNSINLRVAEWASATKQVGGANAPTAYSISNVRVFYDSVKLNQALDEKLRSAMMGENMQLVYPLKTYRTIDAGDATASLNVVAKHSCRYLNGVMLWFEAPGKNVNTVLMNPKQYPSCDLKNLRLTVSSKNILSDVQYLDNVQAMASHTRKCLGLHSNGVDPHGWATYSQYSSNNVVAEDTGTWTSVRASTGGGNTANELLVEPDKEDNAQLFMFYHNFAQSLEHQEANDTFDFTGDGSIVFYGNATIAAANTKSYVTLEQEKYIVIGGGRVQVME